MPLAHRAGRLRLGKTTITWWSAAAAAATLYFQNQGKTKVLLVLSGMAPLDTRKLEYIKIPAKCVERITTDEKQGSNKWFENC